MKTKIILLLFAYFAGYATAIYMLAPAPESQAGAQKQRVSAESEGFDSQQFASSVNTGMHKVADFAAETASHAYITIRHKIAEHKAEKSRQP